LEDEGKSKEGGNDEVGDEEMTYLSKHAHPDLRHLSDEALDNVDYRLNDQKTTANLTSYHTLILALNDSVPPAVVDTPLQSPSIASTVQPLSHVYSSILRQ
jgi:hypothetical protein